MSVFSDVRMVAFVPGRFFFRHSPPGNYRPCLC